MNKRHTKKNEKKNVKFGTIAMSKQMKDLKREKKMSNKKKK